MGEGSEGGEWGGERVAREEGGGAVRAKREKYTAKTETTRGEKQQESERERERERENTATAAARFTSSRRPPP